MKRILLILSVVLLSCQQEENKPDYILSEEEMIEVISEFQVAEATIRLGYHRNPDSLILNDSIYAAMFRKLNISKAMFDSNYTYYSDRPEQLEKIYEKVITGLSTRAAELSANEEKLPEDPPQPD